MTRSVKDGCLSLLFAGLLLFLTALACSTPQGNAFVPVVVRDGDKVVGVQKVRGDAEPGKVVAGALTVGAEAAAVQFRLNGKKQKIQNSDAATRGQVQEAIEEQLDVGAGDFDGFRVIETKDPVDIGAGDFIELTAFGLTNLSGTMALGAVLAQQLESGIPPISPVQFALSDTSDLPAVRNDFTATLESATPNPGGGAVTVTIRYVNDSPATAFNPFLLQRVSLDAAFLNADEGPEGFTLTPVGANGTSDAEIAPGEEFEAFFVFEVEGLPDPATNPKGAAKAAKKFSHEVFQAFDAVAFDAPASTLSVVINSPLPGSTTSTAAILVRGTASGADSVDVNGLSAPIVDGAFSLTVPLFSDGRSRLFASVTTSTPAFDAAADAVEVTRDQAAPRIFVWSPRVAQLVVDDLLNVSGNVLDAGEEVTVSIGAQTVNAGQNGAFLLSNVGLSAGPNPIQLTAIDRAGNLATTSTVAVFDPAPAIPRVAVVDGNLQTAPVDTVVPQTLRAELLDQNEVPIIDEPLIFEVVRGSSTFDGQPAATARRTTVLTDAQGIAEVSLRLGAEAGPGVHQVRASSPLTSIAADFFASAIPEAAVSLHQVGTTPDVALVGERFIVEVVAVDRFGNRVPDVDVDFTALVGGGDFAGLPSVTTTTSALGIARALYTTGATAGVGNEVIADFAGNGGAPVGFVTRAVLPGDPQQSSIVGRLLDPLLDPLQGATARVATGTASSLADGSFALTGLDPGTYTVEIQVPDLGNLQSAETHLRVDVRPGLENGIVPAPARDAALPWLIVPAELGSETLIGLSDTTLADPAANVELLIAADSVLRAGVVTFTTAILSVVPGDQLPAVLPRGESTVAAVFLAPIDLRIDPPAAVSVPNAEQLPAGTPVRFYLFDPGGVFAVDALGTVSADGATVETLPGMGISGSGLIAVAASPQAASLIEENPSPGAGALHIDESFTVGGANRQVGADSAGAFELIVPTFASRQTQTTLLARVRAAGAFGVTGHSGFFDLTPGASIVAPDLFPTSVIGKSPLRLVVTTTAAFLVPGETAQATVTGTFRDGTMADLSQPADGTVYLSTNPTLVQVSDDGDIMAATDALDHGVVAPRAFVVALNDGRWASAAVSIVEPPPDNEPPTIGVGLTPNPALADQVASLSIDGIDNVAIVSGDVEVSATTATSTVAVFSDSFSGAPPYVGMFNVPADALSLLISASASDAAGNTTSTSDMFAVQPPPDTEAPTISVELAPNPALAGQVASLSIDGIDNVAIVSGDVEVSATTATSTVAVFSDSFSGAPPYVGMFNVPADALSLLISASASDAAGNTTSTSDMFAVQPPPDTEAPTISVELAPNPALAGQMASLSIDGTDNVAIVSGDVEVSATTATSTVAVFSDSFSGAPPYVGMFNVPIDALSLLISASASDAAGNTTSTSDMFPVTPPAVPPVAMGENLSAPPVETRIYDVSGNDTYNGATADFELITPPQVTATSADLFQWHGDGTFTYTMPTSRLTDFLVYRISDANGISAQVTAFLSNDPTLLTNLPVFMEGGVAKVSVPGLVVVGLHYPLYQVRLALADVCPALHYHCSGLIFSLELPSAGIPDPDPFQCGLGTFVMSAGETQLLQESMVVTQAFWNAFLAAHPPAVPPPA